LRVSERDKRGPKEKIKEGGGRGWKFRGKRKTLSDLKTRLKRDRGKKGVRRMERSTGFQKGWAKGGSERRKRDWSAISKKRKKRDYKKLITSKKQVLLKNLRKHRKRPR